MEPGKENQLNARKEVAVDPTVEQSFAKKQNPLFQVYHQLPLHAERKNGYLTHTKKPSKNNKKYIKNGSNHYSDGNIAENANKVKSGGYTLHRTDSYNQKRHHNNHHSNHTHHNNHSNHHSSHHSLPIPAKIIRPSSPRPPHPSQPFHFEISDYDIHLSHRVQSSQMQQYQSISCDVDLSQRLVMLQSLAQQYLTLQQANVNTFYEDKRQYELTRIQQLQQQKAAAMVKIYVLPSSTAAVSVSVSATVARDEEGEVKEEDEGVEVAAPLVEKGQTEGHGGETMSDPGGEGTTTNSSSRRSSKATTTSSGSSCRSDEEDKEEEEEGEVSVEMKESSCRERQDSMKRRAAKAIKKGKEAVFLR